VAAAFELREEIEVRALLAPGGDATARAGLEALVSALRDLAEEVRAELEAQADGPDT
jgi:hypothetical protein